MQRKHGFTLIELLVVIAIIAILTAILIPALHTAKKIATGAVCLGNERSLLTGSILYADDHAQRRTWMDKRTLEFIRFNAEDPSSHSGHYVTSPGNEGIKWLIEHFIERRRLE